MCPATGTDPWAVNYFHYRNGFFFLGSKTRLTDAADGTSNVYLLAESKYQVLDLNTSPRPDKRHSWASGAYYDRQWRHYTTLVAAVEPINQLPGGGDYTASSRRVSEPATFRSIGSFHPRGCNMAMGDGSVRFMSQETPVAIHRQLGVIRDGLPVGGPK
jgi:prepilin-type processing-associated H-X9-DG protein